MIVFSISNLVKLKKHRPNDGELVGIGKLVW